MRSIQLSSPRQQQDRVHATLSVDEECRPASVRNNQRYRAAISAPLVIPDPASAGSTGTVFSEPQLSVRRQPTSRFSPDHGGAGRDRLPGQRGGYATTCRPSDPPRTDAPSSRVAHGIPPVSARPSWGQDRDRMSPGPTEPWHVSGAIRPGIRAEPWQRTNGSGGGTKPLVLPPLWSRCGIPGVRSPRTGLTRTRRGA